MDDGGRGSPGPSTSEAECGLLDPQLEEDLEAAAGRRRAEAGRGQGQRSRGDKGECTHRMRVARHAGLRGMGERGEPDSLGEQRLRVGL